MADLKERKRKVAFMKELLPLLLKITDKVEEHSWFEQQVSEALDESVDSLVGSPVDSPVGQSTVISTPGEILRTMDDHETVPIKGAAYLKPLVDLANKSVKNPIKLFWLSDRLNVDGVDPAWQPISNDLCILAHKHNSSWQFACVAKNAKTIAVYGNRASNPANKKLYKNFFNARYGATPVQLIFHDNALDCNNPNCSCLPLVTLAQAFAIIWQGFPDQPTIPDVFNLAVRIALKDMWQAQSLDLDQFMQKINAR